MITMYSYFKLERSYGRKAENDLYVDSQARGETDNYKEQYYHFKFFKM